MEPKFPTVIIMYNRELAQLFNVLFKVTRSHCTIELPLKQDDPQLNFSQLQYVIQFSLQTAQLPWRVQCHYMCYNFEEHSKIIK